MNESVRASPLPAPHAVSNTSIARPLSQRQSIARIIHASGAQLKPQVGSHNDPLEHEAERVARQVLSHSRHAHPDVSIHAQPTPLPLTAPAQAPDQSRDTPPLIDDIPSRLQRLGQGGRPLAEPVRQDMEARFNQDFSSVRVHTDQDGAKLSSHLNARAFTLGEHIAFGSGAFQPHSHSGRHLLAHELTHVVQQRKGRGTDRVLRFPDVDVGGLIDSGLERLGDAADRVGGAVGDLVDSGGNFIASKGWSLVRRVAPQAYPTLRRIANDGPVSWLKEKFSGVFDGLVSRVRQAAPGTALASLSERFSTMLNRAGRILSALTTGDCGPLFQALGELKQFVTDVIHTGWDKLKDFFAPVGDFFADLWQSTAAPLGEFLRAHASQLWDDLQALGARLWRWTQPVRDTLGRAWQWLKAHLFGTQSDDAEGSQGLVGWITDKAGEAWAQIKARTRPLWQPIERGITWLRELAPPGFVAELGDDMQTLSQDLSNAQSQMGAEDEPGARLAQNRAALSHVLPSVQTVIGRVRQVLLGTGDWLIGKVESVTGAVSGLFTGLRQYDLTRALAAPLSWIETGLEHVTSWARDGAKALMTTLVQTFDQLTPFVDRALSLVRHLIDTVADLAKLPFILASNAWQRIPACIRNPVQTFLTEQILGRIPVFSQLAALPDLWQKVQATAMEILRQLFVERNLARAAWQFFSSVLRMIGLPPELVADLLINAASAAGKILQDPIGFLINALKAAAKGFMQFFGNAGQHLMSGIGTWLFGKLAQNGITPPEDFSLLSLLGATLQILDITTERIFERIGERVGPAVATRMQTLLEHATGAWAFIRTVVQEGPGALWGALQERLSDLGDRVINSLVSWISTRVIQQASLRLVPLLAPTGVSNVIAGFLEIYRAVSALAAQLRELLTVVNSFLQGVGDIASGSLAKAADFLEQAMSNAIPAVVGLVAHYAGFGDLGERIRDMLGAVRERVDAALDWLIDRALRAGQAFVNLARRGGHAVRRGVQTLTRWWRLRQPIRLTRGEQHELFISRQGSRAQLMIASTPTRYREFIADLQVPAALNDSKDQALELAESLDQAFREARASEGTTQDNSPDQDAQSAQIDALLSELADVTKPLLEADARFQSLASATPQWGTQTPQGYGTSVSVSLITPSVKRGSVPSVPGPEWEKLLLRRTTSSSYFIRGHLLNEHLGGPGNHWKNLTPLTRSANSNMSKSFEEKVKKRVLTDRRLVNYTVTAHYGFNHPLAHQISTLAQSGDEEYERIAEIVDAERHIPSSLQCRSEEVDLNARRVGPVAEYPVDNRFPMHELGDYEAGGQRRVYINEMTEEQLLRLDGVDLASAKKIAAYREFYRWNQLKDDKKAGLDDAQIKAMRETPGYRVRLFRIGRN